VNVRLLRLVLVLGALASPTLVQGQVERLAGRMDEATRAAVAAVVDSARMAGVPAEPLVNKALEGASKGADGARIVTAVRAGVRPAFLESLRGRYPRESLMVPLAVMADLVARGVPADTAAQSVVALMREGVRDAELVAFRQSVERDIALGAPAGGAVAVRLAGTVPAVAGVTPHSTPRKP